jgi:hypothetical protein
MQQPEAHLGHADKLFDEHGKLVSDGTRKLLRGVHAGVRELGRDDPDPKVNASDIFSLARTDVRMISIHGADHNELWI